MHNSNPNCLYEQDMESEEDEEDEDSDSDPGDIEAEIERLQESLETAQSEQKNLFLIIFQVQQELVSQRALEIDLNCVNLEMLDDAMVLF